MTTSKTFVATGVRSGCRTAGSIALSLTVISLMPACIGEQIKKKTALVLPKADLAFEVAESKNNNGRGNGLGLAIVTSLARAASTPGSERPWGPDMPSDEDSNQDPNNDPTVGLRLRAGMHCRTRLGDKVTVLGTDGNRVLVGFSRDHYIYGGSQEGPALLPIVSGGGLDFTQITAAPACLNNTKLWIEREVFIALQASPAVKHMVKKKAKGSASAEDKEAVRRAMAGN